jgi:transcriptional regulator with XRE-family HTH domain
MPEEFGEERMADQSKKKPNPIDAHVGARIRMRRNMLGMSQEKLGESLGITFQQIQKYEKGTNRVGASRLQAIASIMEVPPAFFFENAPTDELTAGEGFAEVASTTLVMDFFSSAEGIQLNRAFSRIEDPKVRRKIVELIKALSPDDTDK